MRKIDIAAAIPIAAILTVILLVWISVRPTSGPAWDVGQWLYDWQTLIGVFAALTVAYVTVRPVWSQVHLLAVQAAVQLRPIIDLEAAQLDADRKMLARLYSWPEELDQLQEKIAATEYSAPLQTHAVEERLRSIWRRELPSGEEQRIFWDRIDLTEQERGQRLLIFADIARLRQACIKANDRSKRPAFETSEDELEWVKNEAQQIIQTHVPVLRNSLNQIAGDVLESRERLRKFANEIERTIYSR